MRTTPGHPISRRVVLLGAAGSVGLGIVAACTKDEGASTDEGTSTEVRGDTPAPNQTAASGMALIEVFDRNNLAVAGIDNRLAFAVGGSDGVPLATGPEELTFVVKMEDQVIGEPITAVRHDDGTPISYYPLHVTPPTPGAYELYTDLGGGEAQAAFLARETSDLLQPGEQMRDVATPTLDDPLGTNPICTLKPEPCDLHGLDLTEALTTGQPTALLFATPAFCQTAVCGPVLDLLLGQVAEYPDMQFIHCEIYQDKTQSADLVAAVNQYGLVFEPSLFVADADGTVVARLDNVFDRTEIGESLDKATA